MREVNHWKKRKYLIEISKWMLISPVMQFIIVIFIIQECLTSELKFLSELEWNKKYKKKSNNKPGSWSLLINNDWHYLPDFARIVVALE